MKIALIGYGKMGKMIEQIAQERGHSIDLIIDLNNIDSITPSDLAKLDVAIEFTSPHAVLGNLTRCFNAGLPVVVGSTGWYDKLDLVKEQCAETNATMLYASNFSVGVNIFFAMNKYLAKIMNHYPDYGVRVEEIHHIHKLDAPSGTAITIANGITDNITTKNKWTIEKAKSNEELEINCLREGEVPGTHSVYYRSEIDEIRITHEAFNRKGFALGAVLAAEWLHGKKGFYSVEDMFKF